MKKDTAGRHISKAVYRRRAWASHCLSQTIIFSSHPNPNRGSHKKDFSLSLPQKTRGKKTLKETKKKEIGQASKAGASRDELKLVNVKARWQAAPGVMRCTNRQWSRKQEERGAKPDR